MHGATIKIINAQQARLNNIYKITKLNLLKLYVLPADDKRYAVETCRSSESVLKK